MQVANHCNISKETLPLLHPLGDFSSITNASVTGAYMQYISTGVLLSHCAQNHPKDIATVEFLCSYSG